MQTAAAQPGKLRAWEGSEMGNASFVHVSVIDVCRQQEAMIVKGGHGCAPRSVAMEGAWERPKNNFGALGRAGGMAFVGAVSALESSSFSQIAVDIVPHGPPKKSSI